MDAESGWIVEEDRVKWVYCSNFNFLVNVPVIYIPTN